MARLTGNAGGDDNDVSILESNLGTIIGRKKARDLGLGGDVGKVSSNTGGVDNIVESELINEGGELEEEREGLEMDLNKYHVHNTRQRALFLALAGWGRTNLANATRGTSNDCAELVSKQAMMIKGATRWRAI